MNSLLKKDSFVKYSKVDILLRTLHDNKKETVQMGRDIHKNSKKNINIPNNKNYNNLSILDHQNFILDMIMELREFDEKNGTDLFKNISYNNLNTFILKNNL
jgi:hypothetical protein